MHLLHVKQILLFDSTKPLSDIYWIHAGKSDSHVLTM